MNLTTLFFTSTFLFMYGNNDCKAILKDEEKNLIRRKRSQPADREISEKQSRYIMDLKARIFLAQFLKKIDTSKQLPQIDVSKKPAIHKKKGKRIRKRPKGKSRKSKSGENRKRKRKGRSRRKKRRKGKNRKNRKRRKHRRRPRNARGILSRIDYLRKHDDRKKILNQIKEALKIKERDFSWADLRAGYLM